MSLVLSDWGLGKCLGSPEEVLCPIPLLLASKGYPGALKAPALGRWTLSTRSAGRGGQFRGFILSFLDLRGGLSPKAVLGGSFKTGMR